MRAEIARLDLHNRRRLTLAYAIGMALYMLVVVSRPSAIGITTALASVSYLISSLAPVVHWVRPLRFASLFYWSVGDNQLAGGAGLASFAVLVVVAVLAALAASVAFARLDVR